MGSYKNLSKVAGDDNLTTPVNTSVFELTDYVEEDEYLDILTDLVVSKIIPPATRNASHMPQYPEAGQHKIRSKTNTTSNHEITHKK